MSISAYQDKHAFVDAFSLKIEELGHPRIYGQILGWLLICDPPHQSFPDFMENLDISKASVSNTTRMLLEQGIIEKVRVKGERQIYFKLKEGSLVDFMERQLKLTLDLEEITAKGLELMKEKGQPNHRRLTKANDFHRFLAKHTKDLLSEYKDKEGI